MLDAIYKEADIYDDRSMDDSTGGLSGYGSVFHNLDMHGDIVAPGAYLADLPRFLSKGFLGGPDHNHAKPIGVFKEAHEDAVGLYVRASFSSTPFAQETRTLIAEGVIQSLSVGIMPLQVKRLRDRAEVIQYWEKAGYAPTEEDLMRAEKGARLIKRAKLLEISPVALPANDLAEITSYKAGRKISGQNVGLLQQSVAEMRNAIQRLEDMLVAVTASQADAGETETDATGADDLSGIFEVNLASFHDFISR